MDKEFELKEGDSEETVKLKQEAWIMASTLKHADKKLEAMALSLKNLESKGLDRYDLICLIYGRNTSFGKRNIELTISALLDRRTTDLPSFLSHFTRGIKANDIYRVLGDLKLLIKKYSENRS